MQTWTDDQIKASLRKGGYHRERALEYMFKAWFNILYIKAKSFGLKQEYAADIASNSIWALRNEILNVKSEEILNLKLEAINHVCQMVETIEEIAPDSFEGVLILHSYQRGNEEYHLERILNTLRPKLLSVARGCGLRQQDAEDVVQDVMYELIRRIRNTSLDEIQDIKAYGITVTQKKAMTFIEKWTNQRSAYWYDPCYYYDLYNILRWQEVKNEVEKMAEPCRSIILKKGEGYSSSEIADYTKLAISTVRNKIRLCREELYRRLREKPQS